MLVEEQVADRVLTLTLNFNETNIVSAEGLEAFGAALDKYNQDESVRVLVLKSKHDKYFCTGLDPLLFVDQSADTIRQNWIKISEVMAKLLMFERPAVAHISGHCMALGAVWVCACDFRAMVEGSGRIAFSEAVISMNFPSMATQLLRDIVGDGMTRRLLFSGKGLKADQALDAGLVDFLITEDSGTKEVDKLIKDMSKLTLESAKGMKRSLNRHYANYGTANDAWDLEDLVYTCTSKNGQEGFKSLMEGRRPKFD